MALSQRLSLYFDKSNFLTISHKKNTDSTIDIKIVNVYDKEKDCIVYLGVLIDVNKLNWKQHPRLCQRTNFKRYCNTCENEELCVKLSAETIILCFY